MSALIVEYYLLIIEYFIRKVMSLFNKIYNSNAMIKNYFKIAIRNLRKNRVYGLINVMGLAMSMACCILIFTLVKYHLSFDNFHKDPNHIYRFVTEQHRDEISYAASVPPPFGKAFRNDYTFAEQVARAVISHNV